MAEEKFADEVMSEEELDDVAGGTLKEMVKDTKFLKALGLIDHAYSAKQIKGNEEAISQLINDAFGTGGMYAESWIGGKNTYGSVDGDSFANRAAAYKALAAKVKPGFNYKKYL